MRIIPIMLTSTFLLVSCLSDNTDINQNKNIFSGSIQNNETPAIEKTIDGIIATGTTNSGANGGESDLIDDSIPQEATGVYVQ